MSTLTSSNIKPYLPTFLAGFISALAYAYLATNSRHYGDASLVQLLSVGFLCAGLSVCLWAHSHYSKIELSSELVIGFAVLFRLIGLSAFPVLEDDMYRYLWDAHITFDQGTPYSTAPAHFFDSALSDRFESILGLINYPDIATVYGPIAQAAFALAYLISPGDIWPLQLIFSLADIGLIFALLKLAKPSMVMLYAWSPLIVKEFAFTAHPDVLGALFLVLAFSSYQRRHFFWVGLLLALATGVKVFCLIALPFLLGFQWRGWLTFIIASILIALPLTSTTVSIIDVWLPEGLRAMSSDWLFNAPVYVLFLPVVSSSIIKATLLISLALGCGLYLLYALLNWPLKRPRIDLLFLGLLICVPVLNPWYLVWLLPFAVLRPSLWAWTASVSLLLSYASGINLNLSDTESYQIPDWILAIEFGSIALAAAVQRRLNVNKPLNN